MTNPGRYLVVLLLVTVCTAGLNTYHCLVDGAEQPESLIVYLGATHVRFSKRRSSNQVTYYVGAKFPATAVIDWISEYF